MKTSKIIQSLMPYAVSLLILYFIFRKTDFVSIVNELKDINMVLVLLVVVIVLLNNYILSAFLWRKTLALQNNHIPYKNILRARMASYSIRLVMPSKISDMLALGFLTRTEKTSLKQAGVCFLISNILVLISLLIFSIVALFFQFWWIVPIFIILVFSAAGVLYLVRELSIVRNILKIIENEFSAFVVILTSSILTGCLIMLQWSLLFIAAGVKPTILQFMIFAPLTIVLSLIPISIGGLGVREYFLLRFFETIATNELIALGFLIFIVERMVPSIFGVLFTPGLVSGLLFGKKFSKYT